MTGSDDLTQRLQAINDQSLSPSTRDAQLRRVREELERPTPVSTLRSSGSRGPTRRVLLVAAAAVAFLAGSVSILLAANAALPGDGLYGTKRAMELVIGIVNDDVVAEHRVDELEEFISRRAEPDAVMAAQIRMFDALAALADDHTLRARERQLVLGTESSPPRVDRAVDWDRGETFESSLLDGELVVVERRLSSDGTFRYELSITGNHLTTGESGRWRIYDAGNDDSTAPAMLMIIAKGDGVSVFVDPDRVAGAQLNDFSERAAGSDIDADRVESDSRSDAPAPPEPGAAGAGESESAATTSSAVRQRSTTTRPATTSPQTTLETTTTTSPQTTSSGSTSTPPPTTTTSTVKPATTAKPTTSQPTTTRPPTTTTTRPPTTTTTQPPTTTTTQPPTTTTTQPTTTTTQGGDDDDD